MYSNPNLLREIQNKMYALNSTSEGKRKIKRSNRKSKHIEGLRHSLGMGYPLDINHITDKNERINHIKSLKPHFKDLYKAWNYATYNFKFPKRNLPKEEFKKYCENFLFNLEKRIEPDLFKGKDIAHYREMGVRPSGSSVTPPYPAKIPESMEKFFNYYKKLCRTAYNKMPKVGNVDLGSWVHLHLLRIHPFEDGNGRVSRIMNDIILIKSGFPSIMIHQGEKNTYHRFLEEAMIGFRDKEEEYFCRRKNISEGEKAFYDYIAGIVNMKLDELLEK